MNYYVKNIHVNNLYHLHNFDIQIKDEKASHLMITGKNGSGKTILLNAIASFFERIKDDKNMDFTQYREKLDHYSKIINDVPKDSVEWRRRNSVKNSFQNNVDALYGKVELSFSNVADLINDYQTGDFILTFYQAARKPEMKEPKNPTKPVYKTKGSVKTTATSEFLNFMSDLKIQEALARNEKQDADADLINEWFTNFERLLRQIFVDDELRLIFNYKDYSFKINTKEKAFKFTELADGFAAILDIVADLILKMQTPGNVTRAYTKKGIVLIDEVETHLHLELQKMIMPILTSVFPNIQFIISTHSPFVLNSLENAVAFDLEHREPIEELNQYSYEALAEGYFGVSSESSYMLSEYERLKALLGNGQLSDSDKISVKYLIADLNKVPQSVSPKLVGAFLDIKNKYADVIKSL